MQFLSMYHNNVVIVTLRKSVFLVVFVLKKETYNFIRIQQNISKRELFIANDVQPIHLI